METKVESPKSTWTKTAALDIEEDTHIISAPYMSFQSPLKTTKNFSSNRVSSYNPINAYLMSAGVPCNDLLHTDTSNITSTLGREEIELFEDINRLESIEEKRKQKLKLLESSLTRIYDSFRKRKTKERSFEKEE